MKDVIFMLEVQGIEAERRPTTCAPYIYIRDYLQQCSTWLFRKVLFYAMELRQKFKSTLIYIDVVMDTKIDAINRMSNFFSQG